MGDDKHVIGIPELYQEMRSLGDKLVDYINRQDIQSTSQNHQIDELRRDLDELKLKLEGEQIRRATATRQAWMATLSSFLFPILVIVVSAWITTKG